MNHQTTNTRTNAGSLSGLTEDVIRYEAGEMDEEETNEFFQRLVDSGLVWQLQGSYGRTAAALIAAGIVTVRTSLH